jgi:uncharacterized protein (DUF2336 family)
VALRSGNPFDLSRLAEAASGPQSRFDEIYVAVATLFEHQRGAFSEFERNLANDILKRLSKDVEMEIRIRLAERLADDPVAPIELLILLADDKIEVARPVLARSPVLTDADLVQIVQRGSNDHQVVIAERPAIGETVSAALARSACEAAVIALLRNKTAKFSPQTFEHLGERARQTPALQEPLISRGDLPPQLVQRLYVWVSGALKTALAARYPEAARALASAIEETVPVLPGGETPVTGVNAKKLVEKLYASGQLRASFLIRVLNQGQMELFDYAFAALLHMDIETMRKALYGNSPTTVALACRAAGIDRSVFQTVFNLSRHHRRVATKLSDTDQVQIGLIFSQVQKSEALDRLKSAAA